MNTIQKFKLIDGKFTPSEAGIVLSSLINSKINYHQMELFSNEERFAKDLSNSKNRIEQLKNINSSLKKFIDSISDEKYILRIKGVIEIKILDA